MVKDLMKDLTKYLPSVIVPALVGVIALPIITRLFPPDVYGNYVLVITTVNVLSILSVTWIASSVTRFFPLYEKQKETGKFFSTVLRETFTSIAVFFLISWAILIVFKKFINPSFYFLLRIGTILFICNSFERVFFQLLRARRKALWYSVFRVWNSVLWIVLAIILIKKFHFGVEGLLYGMIISLILALPMLWKASFEKIVLKKGKFLSPLAMEMVKYGVPAIGINLLTWGLRLSDRYVLLFYSNSYEVGIYSASYNISEKTAFLITSLFLLPSPPIAYRIWEKKGVEASREFINKVTRYYILIMLPAIIGLSVLAKPIAHLVFPVEYTVGFKIIPIVAFGALLVGFAHRFSLVFGYFKRNDINMLCFFVALTLNLGLNFCFIPKYGYIAAAVTTSISYALLLLITIVTSRRFLAWRFPFKSLFNSAVASLIMGIVVYFINNNLYLSLGVKLFIAITVGCVIYLAVILLLREVRSSEIKKLLILYQS